ncbi:MAG: hypothetical protein Q9167_005897 [Letrouitia subvulpina]
MKLGTSRVAVPSFCGNFLLRSGCYPNAFYAECPCKAQNQSSSTQSQANLSTSNPNATAAAASATSTTIPLSALATNNAQDAWTVARKRYLESLTTEDQATFQHGSLDSVLAEFTHIEATHRAASFSRKWGLRMKPFLTSLEQIDRAMNTFASVQPMPAALIWGSVQLVMRVFKGWVEGFEKLVEMFERIADNLPHLKASALIGAKSVFEPFSAIFDQSLIDFKDHKVLVEDTALAVFIEESQNEWSQMSEERLKATREREMADAARKAAEASFLQAEKHYIASSSFYDKSIKEMKNTSFQTLTNWLCPANPRNQVRYLKYKQTPGTCQWIKTNDKINAIRTRPKPADSDILWIQGKAGSGKSILASAIVDTIEQQVTQDNGLSNFLILPFFFSAVDPQRRSSIQAIGGLLRQVLQQKRDLLPSIEAIYEPTNVAPDDLGRLWDTFIQTTEGTDIVIVIDALDECNDAHIFLLRLAEIASKSSQLSAIVLSRNEAEIEKEMTQHQSIHLTNDFLENDIEAFTRYDVDSRLWSVGDTEVKEKIVSSLSENANGMFLWVRLMVDHLKSHVTQGELESFLSDLPAGLDNAYKRILQRLSAEPSQLRHTAIRFLRWVACAARPLLLEELSVIFAVQKGQRKFDRRGRLLAPREIISRLLGSLLEILPNNTIQFVHLSGRDFLKSALITNDAPMLAEFHIIDQIVHREIVESLLTYLGFDEYVDHLPKEKPELEKACQRQPYLEYASRYWTHHLQASKSTDPGLLQQVLDFLESDQALTWLEGPAMVFAPSMTGLLVLQSQLNEWASEFDEDMPGVSQIFDVVIRVYESTYQYTKAEFGREAEVTVKALTYLGLLQHARGAFAQAEVSLAETVDLTSRIYGSDHNKTLDSINNYALNLQSMGKTKESEALFRKTLNGWIANDGPDSYNALWGLNNLVNSLITQERNEEAEILLKKAVDGHSKLQGENSPDTLRAATTLSHV